MQRLTQLYAKWLNAKCGERQTPLAVWLLVLSSTAIFLAILTGAPGVAALHRGVPFDGSFTWIGGDKYGNTSQSTYPMKPVLTVDGAILIIGIPLFSSRSPLF